MENEEDRAFLEEIYAYMYRKHPETGEPVLGPPTFQEHADRYMWAWSYLEKLDAAIEESSQ